MGKVPSVLMLTAIALMVLGSAGCDTAPGSWDPSFPDIPECKSGCSNDGTGTEETDTGEGTDTAATDTDTGTDTDADTDSDADSDADTDSDADSDADTDTGSASYSCAEAFQCMTSGSSLMECYASADAEAQSLLMTLGTCLFQNGCTTPATLLQCAMANCATEATACLGDT